MGKSGNIELDLIERTIYYEIQSRIVLHRESFSRAQLKIKTKQIE